MVGSCRAGTRLAAGVLGRVGERGLVAGVEHLVEEQLLDTLAVLELDEFLVGLHGEASTARRRSGGGGGSQAAAARLARSLPRVQAVSQPQIHLEAVVHVGPAAVLARLALQDLGISLAQAEERLLEALKAGVAPAGAVAVHVG